jgi:hypothetical protein
VNAIMQMTIRKEREILIEILLPSDLECEYKSALGHIKPKGCFNTLF